MARTSARILASIWDDPEFLALRSTQQRLYLFLLSQRNLDHAGLLPLTLRRWAGKAKSLTAAGLKRDLAGLAEARFIVVDFDTEEVLIRTFVRGDGVYKQPRLMGAMVSAAEEISSPVLRRALLDEVERLPLNELSDEPSKGDGPSIRRQVEEHVEALRSSFALPEATPTPCPSPSGQGAQGDPEGVSEGAQEAGTEGKPTGSRCVRGCAGACACLSPVPLPLTPEELPSSSATAAPPPFRESTGRSAHVDKPVDNRALAPDPFDEFWTVWPRKVSKSDARKAWDKAVTKGRTDPAAILAAATSYAARCELMRQDPKYIPHPATWLNRRSWDDDLDAAMPLPALARTGDGTPPPSDFDAHMARFLARHGEAP